MYNSSSFQERDAEKVLAFMEANPFVTLVGFDGCFPVATQVPVQVMRDGEGIRVIGHVMKKTDHALAFERNENVLVIFSGAHAYVSASVYENPASASTWNYSTIQVKGRIRLMDEVETRSVIQSLTDQYEDPSSSPAAFHRMSDTYIDQHVKAINGFEVISEEIMTTFKLSQNHKVENREAIIAHLAQSEDAGARGVAKEMKERG